MPLYLKPHSPEWFAALKTFNPMQAAATERVVKLAGNSDVCSVCGDDPAKDYKLVAENLPQKAVATVSFPK